MLSLEHICKSYTTSSFTQRALDDVSLAFRNSEFVSILGPSGSGKTTLLNVIGGLDHFDGGDLVVDGVSTRAYRDRDWDAYRNNRIGFVFQSYNLIPHQTVLANVELALTLSGVSSAERRERARKALADVGLAEHVDKRPSQLSGGQMQRVAIARALINDPEILLADEPTGALDSRTSVQVMDLLRNVANDRLVIMVTHNPELAREYSTRIVELADGKIRSDTDPFAPGEDDLRDAKPVRRTSMSFLTALSLSFNNLMTKKGRTLMTAFAGSIGIIGIAAILSLANGVNAYIQEVEEKTLSAYPLQIMSSGFDMTSLFVDVEGDEEDAAEAHPDAEVGEQRMVGAMFGSVGANDLAALRSYLQSDEDGIGEHVQAIEYVYNVVPQVFSYDEESGAVRQVNPDTSFSAFGIGNSTSAVVASSSLFNTNVFAQLPANMSLVEGQYDVKAGRWPRTADELVVVLSRSGNIADLVSYALGLRDHAELEEMVRKVTDQEEFEAPTDVRTYTYAQLMEPTFRVVPASSLYAFEERYGVWTDKTSDEDFVRKQVAAGRALRIVGVVQPREDVDATTISQGIYYTPELTYWLMQSAAESRIVQEQLAHPTTNVISGKSFDNEAREAGDFDMSSLFSIDEDKLSSAFAMDADALDLEGMDLSGVDFSGITDELDLTGLADELDLSGVEVPEVDLSQLPLDDLSGITFDLSQVDLSGVNLTSLVEFDMNDMLEPYFGTVSPQTLLAGITPTIDQAKLQAAIAAALQGLPAYLAEQQVDASDQAAYAAAVSAYFAQPTVSAQLMEDLRGAVTISEADQARMAANLRGQMGMIPLTNEDEQGMDERTALVIAALSDQVGDQLATQVADQVGQQLSLALASTLATTLQEYLGEVLGAYMTQVAAALQEQVATALANTMEQAMGQMMEGMARSIVEGMAGSMHVDEEKFAEAFQFNMDEKELSELMMSLMSTERTSLDNNLAKLGYAREEEPSEIDIYPTDFDSKALITQALDAYNERMRAAGEDDKAITYTDIVGALMSSVTSIVNMISYVLIAFVAISLVVSSIMIGVITYISVLERKKEIGILRAIGASKRDISRVFNAETVIEGLVSGLMGVGITALGCIPANAIVEQNFDVERVARLPLGAAIVLVAVSVALSFVAGLLPSRKAAKADPVEALRSE